MSAHSEGTRYRAFLSYSHRDAAFAARLHRRLEAYVLPSRLGANRRLAPVFKDREELPAARDLSDQVQAALAASDCLIVACSPDAAASPWVTREIETFRSLHPDRPILAALILGEPAEAFPAALYEGGAEPLAADFRKDGDGERLAFLKLVAGVAGVGVDQLIQRDAQRRLRAVMAITAAALVAVVAMGGMTFVALEARAEAERQRAEAEGLVEFMLTDLRDKLKGVGRLDVLTAVNKRALTYYGGQQLERLPQTSLQRRARLLMAMGEDDVSRGDLAGAQAKFDEAYRVTRVLLKAAPENADRVWAHAQSTYWRGYIAFRRHQTGLSRKAWEEYRLTADSLMRIEPEAARSFQELAYAEGNLCTLALEQEKDLGRALSLCKASLVGMQEALDRRPGDVGLTLDVGTRLAWLADVQVELKDFPSARESRLRQVALLRVLLARDPANANLLDNWGVSHRGLSLVAYRSGDVAAARNYLLVSQSTFHQLSEMDPENSRWRSQAEYADRAVRILTAKTKQEMVK